MRRDFSVASHLGEVLLPLALLGVLGPVPALALAGGPATPVRRELRRCPLQLTDAASTLLSKDYDFKGKTLPEIRRAAVAMHLGDAAVKDMSDDAVAGAFAALTANAPKSGTRDLVNAFRAPIRDSGISEKDRAYAENLKYLGDAWKTQARA